LAMLEGHAANKLVFPAPRGGYLERGTFRTRLWNRLLERLHLERRGFHHTRHTYACLALADGVPLPTVSQILGHAKQETTLRFYSRHLPGHQKTATESATRLFG
jgi:integrase